MDQNVYLMAQNIYVRLYWVNCQFFRPKQAHLRKGLQIQKTKLPQLLLHKNKDFKVIPTKHTEIQKYIIFKYLYPFRMVEKHSIDILYLGKSN